MNISVIIPAYNAANFVGEALQAVCNQLASDDELIVVDDASTDNTATVAERYARVITLEENSGPATARNVGIANAQGDIIAFVDADCIAASNWLKNIRRIFEQSKQNQVIMGKVVIPNSTFIGDCIAALGFPAGGHVGFENVWHVDPDGRTDHISSCNFATRRYVFEEFGMFDETFPLAGGEDSELSYRWFRQGVIVRFESEVYVTHRPRTSLKSFCKWQIQRGRSNYHFKQRVGSVRRFVKLRLWSTGNILKKYKFSIKLPMILLLLTSSFCLQQWGYALEAYCSQHDGYCTNA